LTDHREDLPVSFIGIVESWGVDKDELVVVFLVVQDPVRGDFIGAGLQTPTRSRVLPSQCVDDLCERLELISSDQIE